MAEGDTQQAIEDRAKGGRGAIGHLIELVKVLALPLVTLVVGYWFNTSLDQRQQIENNTRLYAEMMGRREESDSNLRKDMFNSILNTFMSRDPRRSHPSSRFASRSSASSSWPTTSTSRSTSARCSRT